jgi:large subunit ribosomal protein L23
MALFRTKKAVAGNSAKAAKKSAKTATSAAPAASMKDLYSETAAPAKQSKSKTTSTVSSLAYRTLVKPLITEKATNLSAANKYVFVVERAANKIEVAKAIQSIYGVKPVSVNLLNVSGKVVRRGRISGRRKAWRKAIVTLAKGETIKIYEGV